MADYTLRLLAKVSQFLFQPNFCQVFQKITVANVQNWFQKWSSECDKPDRVVNKM